MHYETAITKVSERLQNTVHYDWIDAPIPGARDGLNHVEDTDSLVSNAFIIEISVPVDCRDTDAVAEVDKLMEEVADEYNIAYDSRMPSSESKVYTFYLHSMVLSVPQTSEVPRGHAPRYFTSFLCRRVATDSLTDLSTYLQLSLLVNIPLKNNIR